jgi:multicomponent Na+:H+ antiporter subunit A
MFGVPPVLGWFAKEEVYLSLGTGNVAAWVGVAVLVLGNAMLGAVALAFLVRPFFGPQQPPSGKVHEGGFSLWIGPALFGLAGLAVLFAVGSYGDLIVGPMASAMSLKPIPVHLGFGVDFTALPIWLTVGTWALAGLIYWQLDAIRTILRRLEQGFTWNFDRGFDQLVFGLVRLAGAWTRLFHHGRLELYLVLTFACVALALLLPLARLGGWPAWPVFASLSPYEWGAVALALVGIVAVVLARTRLFAIVALGIQGLALALLFLFYGAPDLGFTQLMIEVLSVVILALVMTRLNLTAGDPRPAEDWLRDGALALITGVAIAALLLRVLQNPFDSRLSDFFAANSAALAHGRNIVNVIIVDFRGLDTLGEISVLMTAGIAVLALLRKRKDGV